jgi:hypothetical protein
VIRYYRVGHVTNGDRVVHTMSEHNVGASESLEGRERRIDDLSLFQAMIRCNIIGAATVMCHCKGQSQQLAASGREPVLLTRVTWTILAKQMLELQVPELRPQRHCRHLN